MSVRNALLFNITLCEYSELRCYGEEASKIARKKGVCFSAPALKKAASKSKAAEPAPAASPFNAGKYAVGDLISHPMFGDGIVTAIDANKLTIEFPNKIINRLSTIT